MAEGVEWWFTINKYRELTGNPNWATYGGTNPLTANNQFRRTDQIRSVNDITYTTLVIDLIDDFNQRAARGNDINFPNDRVSGYTIQQIEQALYANGGVSLFSNWKHNLLNMFDNPTEQFVHALFESWD